MPVIRETRKIFTQPIGVRSFDTGEQNVGRAISNFANKAGQEFYERAKINAEKFGSEAAQSIKTEDLKVFDSATGKPEVLSSTEGMGSIASSAFEQVVERRFVDAVDKDIRLKSAELASKYEDPVQYQNMFEAYLGSMSKGADDRFKNVIMDSGTYIMGSTKIQLADAARAKSRAAAARDVSSTNTLHAETVYDAASTNQHGVAVAIIEERITASLEAEKAELYDKGYSRTVASQLGAQAMSGALEVALTGATPIQQASIKVFIGSQGKSGGEGLTPDQLATLNPYIGYVDRANTGSLLAQANVVSTNFNEVTSAKIAKEKAEYEAAMNQLRASITGVSFAANAKAEALKKGSEAFVDDLGLFFTEDYISPSRFAATTSITKAWASQSAESISGSVLAAQSLFDRNLKILRKGKTLGLGDEEYKSLSQDARRASLDAVILGLTNDGRIDALKVALVTNKPEDIAKLTSLQQHAINSLTQTMLYDPTEDRAYVGTLLSGSVNENEARLAKEQTRSNVFAEFSDVSTTFVNGVYDLEAIGITEALGDTALKNGDITAPELDSLIKGLRSAAGIGISNIVSGNMSSSELTDLSVYVLSGGEKGSMLNTHVVTAGDSILSLVPSSKLSSVSNHINSVREKVAKQEAKRLADQQVADARTRVLTGGGNVTSKSDRSIQSEILADQGFVLIDPSTYNTPERKASLLQSLRETPSKELIDGLKNISLGLETPGADALLDLFSVLSNDLTSTGLFVNRFGTGEGAPISAKDTAFLQAVMQIRMTEGGSAKEVAMALKDITNDDKSKLNIGLVFGDQSPEQYLASEFKSDIIAAELGDTAEYLALIGGSERDVKARLEEIVDTYYHKTRVVVDPRFPVGEISRTMYSLEKVFPNEGRRDAFINVIASELPDGYRLRNYATRAPDRVQVPVNIATQGNLDLEMTSGVTATAVGDQPKPKDVYLVPNETTTGIAYYAYYVDDINELRPLIMDIDGEQGIPMWDESELADYDAQALIDKNAADESRLDARESVLDVVRKRPGMRSFDEIKNITFGRGGN
jgi:hypothetical protein